MTMHYEVDQFHRQCLRMAELVRSRLLESRELAYLDGSLDMVKAEIQSLLVKLAAREDLARREAQSHHRVEHHEGYGDDFCGWRCQRRTGHCTGCGDDRGTQVNGLCLACRDNNERAHSWCPS